MESVLSTCDPSCPFVMLLLVDGWNDTSVSDRNHGKGHELFAEPTAKGAPETKENKNEVPKEMSEASHEWNTRLQHGCCLGKSEPAC